MRNRYPAKCIKCGNTVERYDGILRGKRYGVWVAEHDSCNDNNIHALRATITDLRMKLAYEHEARQRTWRALLTSEKQVQCLLDTLRAFQ